ncbi:MAG: 2-dehydropantoate 2-reductase [Halofilum sp. (in: g-proteobacteria)]
MKICIFGSGAIGGYIGVELARAGADVSLIARGPHLAAMKENGVKLLKDGEEHVVHPRCTDDPAELGPQDYVIVCLKAHSVPAVVDDMQPLLGPDTTVVTAVNGIPYWYFYQDGSDLEGKTLECVDPGAKQWNGLGPERALGCVVYPATEVVEPGVIKHVYGDKFPLGEPDGSASQRATALSEMMEKSGLRAPVLNRIRDEIWLKLWGNVSFNPISALTLETLDNIAFNPETRAVAKAMMLEAQEIGTQLGVNFRVDVERRIDGAGKVGAHKTSMLQDLESGRPMEIDALVTSVQEMGQHLGVPTPTIDTVLALVKQRAQQAGVYTPLAPPAQETAAPKEYATAK